MLTIGNRITIFMKKTSNNFQTIWVYNVASEVTTCSDLNDLSGVTSITSLGGDSSKTNKVLW